MTVKEIASLAGVSPAAVSIVLNNRNGVSEETRKRIQSILDEHKYTSKKSSRGKCKGAANILLLKYSLHGMIVEENQGFISSIIDQIEISCREYSFNLVMHTCNKKDFEEVLKSASSDEYIGIILIGTEIGEEQIKAIRTVSIPIVVVDNAMFGENIDSVVMDNAEITRCAMKYLYDRGFRSIGYFKSSVPISNFTERDRAYKSTLDALNLSASEVVSLTPTLTGAYEDMKKYLKSNGTLPEAVFAVNDTIAIGAMKAIIEFGVRVPEDVSIIGVDDIPYSSVCHPSISTIRISRKLLGVYAVQLMRGRIKYPDSCNVRLQVRGQTVERESTRNKPER